MIFTPRKQHHAVKLTFQDICRSIVSSSFPLLAKMGVQLIHRQRVGNLPAHNGVYKTVRENQKSVSLPFPGQREHKEPRAIVECCQE